MRALPGSAYPYQGEELGLHEVTEIDPQDREGPAFFRNPGVGIGSDGCRVPLPWAAQKTALGFSATGAHLPQSQWFGPVAADAQDTNLASPLNLYRDALTQRRKLQGPEDLQWVETKDPPLPFS